MHDEEKKLKALAEEQNNHEFPECPVENVNN